MISLQCLADGHNMFPMEDRPRKGEPTVDQLLATNESNRRWRASGPKAHEYTQRVEKALKEADDDENTKTDPFFKARIKLRIMSAMADDFVSAKGMAL